MFIISPYFKRIASVLLLLIFVFGITPKRFLHEIFAKHTDDKYGRTIEKPYQLTKSGYNCDCDNLVAESAFVSDAPQFSFPLFSSFPAYLTKHISFSSASDVYSSLRGPPVKI